MKGIMVFGIGSVLLLSAVPARAKNECIADANSTAKECRSDCMEDFQVAKDACLNRDHHCVEACRAGREDCELATGLDAALAACNATQTGAVHDCRQQYAKGTPERDTCIDQAQLVGFQCRKQARNHARLAMNACRAGFRTCARACGPPTQPDPTAVPQCKRDARATNKTCQADCREDMQVAKDACHNRDHACVEQCRLDRKNCTDPVLTQLAADIAACNADRDNKLQNCHNLYGDGTPELSHCIQDAQAQAFECRDGKREAARPQLRACRQTFLDCARACPPPSPS